MAFNGFIPISEWSKADLRQYRYWKELMTPDERRDRYQLLRLFGATRPEAMRWRDWSEQQYELMLQRLNDLAKT
jgi:hypothetical protein